MEGALEVVDVDTAGEDQSCYKRFKNWPFKTPLFVLCVPIVFLPLPILINTQWALTGYVMIIMAVYWVTEVIPLSATALLPVVLFPLLGITDTKTVCFNYMKDTIMLLVGGLMVAIAVEKSALHRRMAVRILLIIGGNPKWLMLGFMLPTWFLSMWISNTATTAMMLPIANAVLVQLEESAGMHSSPPAQDQEGGYDNEALDVEDKDSNRAEGELEGTGHVEFSDEEKAVLRRLSKGLTICVAYAANVGGTATLTGTAPNIVMKGVTDDIFGDHGVEPAVSFATWMLFGLPMSLILVLLVWIWMQIFFLRSRAVCWPRTKEQEHSTKEIIRKEYAKLGPIRFAEIMVLFLFVVLVLLWFFRDPKFMPGWASLFKPKFTHDALPAVAITIVMFFFPVQPPCRAAACSCWLNCSSCIDCGSKSNEMLLDWKIIHERMPWTLVFLLGGGFAMAQAATSSGLSQVIGDGLNAFNTLPDWLMIMVLCLLVALMTEVTSNTATCTLLMHIVAVMAEKAGKNPLYLMFPVAISTSFAFMLPVATPPNAIAFATGRITVIDMIKSGAILNILGVLVVTLATQTWGLAYFNLDTLPWASDAINATTAIP